MIDTIKKEKVGKIVTEFRGIIDLKFVTSDMIKLTINERRFIDHAEFIDIKNAISQISAIHKIYYHNNYIMFSLYEE